MNESKAYYTIDEAAEMLQRNRATVYNRMKLLEIKGHRFPRTRKTYLTATEVEQLKNVFEKPWLAGEVTKEEGQAEMKEEPQPA